MPERTSRKETRSSCNAGSAEQRGLKDGASLEAPHDRERVRTLVVQHASDRTARCPLEEDVHVGVCGLAAKVPHNVWVAQLLQRLDLALELVYAQLQACPSRFITADWFLHLQCY